MLEGVPVLIRGLVLLVLFGALVYMGVRWRQGRMRVRAVHDELQIQMGRRGIVTETVTAGAGLVRINGAAFAACADGPPIGPRVLVEVVAVRRFRLLVRRVEGQGRLIDVDHITGRKG